jgi:hypothetical protein
MNRFDLVPALRMGERALIDLGGIFSIYFGYRLFVLGINVAQGQARAFGIELRDFGPGLFFAALGAYVLVQALRAAIHTGTVPASDTSKGEAARALSQEPIGANTPVAPNTTFFFGVEDPIRQLNKWSAKSFFLDTRELLRQLDAGTDPAEMESLRRGLKMKLETITMMPEEYQRYQLLTNKPDLSPEEQREFLVLEDKLFP